MENKPVKAVYIDRPLTVQETIDIRKKAMFPIKNEIFYLPVKEEYFKTKQK